MPDKLEVGDYVIRNHDFDKVVTTRDMKVGIILEIHSNGTFNLKALCHYNMGFVGEIVHNIFLSEFSKIEFK